jgi:hypothetical protein
VKYYRYACTDAPPSIALMAPSVWSGADTSSDFAATITSTHVENRVSLHPMVTLNRAFPHRPNALAVAPMPSLGTIGSSVGPQNYVLLWSPLHWLLLHPWDLKYRQRHAQVLYLVSLIMLA